MVKFGRIYELVVQGQTIEHTLKFPLTCKFNIERKNFSMANSASFTIYGLSLSSRKDIYYDTYFKKKLVPITFKAGFMSQPSLPTIFKGNVTAAYTSREGPELVTHITALDGGFGIDTSMISQTIEPPWRFTQTIKRVMSKLDGVEVGQVLIGPEPKPSESSVTFNGKVWDVLKQYVPEDGSLFIDNGVVNMLGQNITLPSPGIRELSSETGLLNIPKKFGYQVDCDCLFEPQFTIGQSLNLKSSLAPWVNGPYKVIGLHHSGTISGVESGDARTGLSLLSTAAVVA